MEARPSPNPALPSTEPRYQNHFISRRDESESLESGGSDSLVTFPIVSPIPHRMFPSDSGGPSAGQAPTRPRHNGVQYTTEPLVRRPALTVTISVTKPNWVWKMKSIWCSIRFILAFRCCGHVPMTTPIETGLTDQLSGGGNLRCRPVLFALADHGGPIRLDDVNIRRIVPRLTPERTPVTR